MVKLSSNDVELGAIVLDNQEATPAVAEDGYTKLYTTVSGIYTIISGNAPVGPFIDSDLENTDLSNAKLIEFYSEYDNGNASGSMIIDWNNGQKQRVARMAACTFTFTPPAGVCNVMLKLYQGYDAPTTPTWPLTVLWEGGVEPTWSTQVSGTDLVGFYYDGTNYFGSAGIGFA